MPFFDGGPRGSGGGGGTPGAAAGVPVYIDGSVPTEAVAPYVTFSAENKALKLKTGSVTETFANIEFYNSDPLAFRKPSNDARPNPTGSYRIDWGDGTVDLRPSYPGGGALNHQYKAAGTYTVLITAPDEPDYAQRAVLPVQINGYMSVDSVRSTAVMA